MSDQLRFAGIQTSLFWEDIPANLATLEEKMWQITTPIDVIVLPEMFNTGFSMNATKLAETLNGHTHKWMKQMAKLKNAAVAGSLIIREDTRFFNRFLWVEPSGKTYFYNKKNLFSYSGEDGVYTKGQDKCIISFKGWNICPIVCYDLRFPEWCRNRIINDEYAYDILLCVANWPSSRIQAWDTLTKARAIENTSFVFAVNITGKDGKNLDYTGHSQACYPSAESFGLETEESGILYHTFDKKYLTTYRQKFSFLKDAD